MILVAGSADVHKVLATLEAALARHGATLPSLDLERGAFLVHQALAGHARAFHTHDHALAMARGDDPLEDLAGLFHDVVYVQVDQGFAGPSEQILRPFIACPGAGRFHLTAAVREDPVASMVAAIFGRGPGDDLSPYTGLNELASALVAAKSLESGLDRRSLAEIAACIEATIPFRDGSCSDALARRLADLGLPDFDDAALHAAVRRAVRLANRDVENFAEEEPGRFLDNTWKLLPESNPALQTPSVYTAGQFRVALQKMEGFLSSLTPPRVFRSWGGEPPADEYARMLAHAGTNLGLAGRYLRAKLYAAVLIEALAIASGGDAPLDFFMGGMPRPGAVPPRKAQEFLPPPVPSSTDLDPLLLRLLEEGRSAESLFDIPASPFTAFLYRSLGEGALMERMAQCRAFLKGEIGARALLERHSCPAVAAIARATAQVAVTRKNALERLAGEIGRA
jgi:hypothetical protein